MKRKLIIALLFALLITGIPAVALAKPSNAKGTETVFTEPVIFETTITVDKKGGKFDVGFVTIQFNNDWLPGGQYPAEFDVKICARDGEPCIEITPDVEAFSKPVLIKTDKYDGYLYDETTGKNIFVSIKSQVVVAKHFSWYRFR
ncbi:MAG TPA: hypothetical protein PLA01_03010 [Acetivibrio sp.]|nr:hypothetical protein [Acetivibrio sp.]